MFEPRPRPDDPARRRIVTDLDSNLLVEAGAGSGKTHELAARMAAGVASGAYDVERMAAVTFTRKAAAELRGRFQLALEAELTRCPAPEAARRIGHALSNLERFFAGTIHAFCARLLRERPVEAGVSPGFTELDEVEEQLLRQQSWRDYRAQAAAAGDPDLVAVLEAGISAKQLDDAFKTVCLYEDVTFPPGDSEVPDAKTTWKALEKFWAGVASRLPASIDPKAKCPMLERAARFDRAWKFARHQERTSARLAALLAIWQAQPNATLKWWPTERAAREARALHAEFRETVALPYLTAWRHYLYCRCVGLLTRARDAARSERRRGNTLSFNDLLIITAEVLRSNAGVRRALQQRYRWLFVDEFQDTDPIQAEIVFLLAADEAAEAGMCDWRTVALRPGSLFVVGDPKQSIYRFRRADIDIYNEVRARLGGAGGAGVVSLTTNFRSVPGLCTWANRVFERTFPAEPTAHAPKFAPLDSDRRTLSGVPDVAVLNIPAEVESSEVAREEASRIARYIRAEVDAGRRKFGDFLILTRKKKALQPYAGALESLQVPIEVTGAGAFGESPQVRHLALLLAVLADPQDAVALVGVLRGPFFGLSDRELFAYRQNGGWLSVFADSDRGADRGVVREDAASGHSHPGAPRAIRVDAVASALSRLNRWHRWTRLLPAGAALERVLEDSGYLALAATTPGGVEAGDLLHAIDRVRSIVESGFTLAAAADALAAWSGLDEDGPEDSTEVDSLPLEPGRRDVVRLMNLHKAKGLEADVVFLADPLGGFEPRADARILRDRSRATAVGYFQIVEKGKHGPKVLAEPAGWDSFKTDELAYLNAEVHRLLYVAATRARDTLIIGRWPGRPGNRTPAWDAFDPFLSSASAIAVPDTVSPPAAPEADVSAAAAGQAIAAASAAHERSRQPSWSATSVTAEAKRLPRVTLGSPDEVADDDPTRGVVADTPSRRADAGIAWGTLIHGLLEHAMRYRSATRDDLRRLALWLTVEAPELRVFIDRALETVEAVEAGDFWQEARASAECHEEAPFSRLQPDPVVPNVLSGTIDLVYRSGDEWRIVDYKTDADFARADLAARHRAQLQAYEQAWGGVARAPVKARIVGAR